MPSRGGWTALRYRTGWIGQAGPRHPVMSSPWAVAVFVAAAALSLGASAVLVVRLERVGARLGLSEALLGLVAALAADTPEVTSAVTALAHGQHDVGTGVVLGSNVFNLAALIGLGAVVAGGKSDRCSYVCQGGRMVFRWPQFWVCRVVF